ncbi:MAG: hypothetical protein HC913_04835 [Microscillaceae bacterium]|nr:hypothetical protein [Microscillaceae bacterium]
MMNNLAKFICFSFISFLFFSKASAQDYSITIGTEFPYQHYLGFNLKVKDLDISLRTGILTDPYSDILIDALSIYDYPEEILDLLKATYEFGWMNSIGVYKRFGKRKQWYVGPEFKIDYLNAETTPVEIFETLYEDARVRNLEIIDENTTDIDFGLTTFAFGIRVGRTFQLVKDNPRHLLNAEFAIYRYISINSKVTVDGNNSGIVDAITDELLWQDFFGPYGQFPVLGISYTYLFSKKK